MHRLVRHLRFSPANEPALRVRALLTGALLLAILTTPPSAQAAPREPHLTDARPLTAGPLNSAQKHLLRQGYLVPNQAAYDRSKAASTTRVTGPRAAAAGAASPLAPVAGPSFAGLRDTQVGPPDTTGTVGTTRFIETINNKFGIYSKTSTTPISTGTLSSLW